LQATARTGSIRSWRIGSAPSHGSVLTESAESRAEVDAKLSSLASSMEKVAKSGAGAAGSGAALQRVAEGQERLVAVLESQGGDGIDAESRMRLRSMDVQMLKILEELSAGRQETMAALRQDIEGLARALTNTRPARSSSRRETRILDMPAGEDE